MRRISFFERAKKDLHKCDLKNLNYGKAFLAVNRIKDALNAQDNLKLGQAYIDALFYLNKKKCGPELIKIILTTLRKINNKKIDAGDFHFGSEKSLFNSWVMWTIFFAVIGIMVAVAVYHWGKNNGRTEYNKILRDQKYELTARTDKSSRMCTLF
jgi:hypothetical protein